MHVYRWDLDKTYLDTDFGSISGLVRSATEPAHAKRAIPGAAALVRSLSAIEDVQIAILSGSPTQMRSVLQEKLRLDGVRFDELILKDNLDNLKRGRLRAIRGQLGYKLPALLEARSRTQPDSNETLFGDDAEADALVYSVYADVVAGRLGAASISRIMEAGGAYPDQIDRALEAASVVTHFPAVEHIFIRLDKGVPTRHFDPLGPRVIPITSWWQAALVLVAAGHLGPNAIRGVLESVMFGERLDPWAVAALTQDVVRRGHVKAADIETIDLDEKLQVACKKAVSHLRGTSRDWSTSKKRIDYVQLLRRGSSNGWTGRGPTE